MTRLKLHQPINYANELISELEFQELKAKHLRYLPKEIAMNDILGLASTLTGQVPKVIDELSSADTIRVVEVINGFFQNSQETMKIS
jgi:hypothetical protein